MNPTPNLKVRLSPAAEKAVRRGHPWVYADKVREQSRDGTTGELAIVYDRNNRFLAIGLFDANSPIAIRVLHVGSPQKIDDAWWAKRMQSTLKIRESVFADGTTTGYRCVNGESDGWPGLVLDRYDDTAVLKLYTSAWFAHLDKIIDLIKSQLRPTNLILRLSRNIRELASDLQLKDGQILFGETLSNPVIFRENGLSFEADVIRGQKTGFFLDQRENRQRVRALSPQRDVLNVFSHTGGFSVYAAAGGARSATDLDISGHALDSAKRNMALNSDNHGVANCDHATVKSDAFQWLAQQPSSRFDLIIIDPPSLAKRESEKAGAIAAYEKLALEGVRLLKRRGVLVAASCSAHVPASEFFEIIRKKANSSSRPFREIETTLNAPDHPANIPEAHYLKCIYLEFD